MSLGNWGKDLLQTHKTSVCAICRGPCILSVGCVQHQPKGRSQKQIAGSTCQLAVWVCRWLVPQGWWSGLSVESTSSRSDLWPLVEISMLFAVSPCPFFFCTYLSPDYSHASPLNVQVGWARSWPLGQRPAKLGKHSVIAALKYYLII